MKNQQDYVPILTDSTHRTFFDYVGALNIPQIDYIAIGVQNIITQQSISLMSNLEWQKHFSRQGYAHYDPVRRIALYTKRNFIPISEVDYNDNFGKEIMRQRALAGIKKGIILMKRFSTHNYMITLGTAFSKFEAFDFIRRYNEKIFFIQKDLIKLIEKESRQFLSE